MVREGEDGFLCPKQDPEALAEALAHLLSDPALRARMGESGRARYETLFTLDLFERNIVDILKRHIDA